MQKFTISYGYRFFDGSVEIGAIVTEAQTLTQIEEMAMKAVLLQISKDTQSDDLIGLSNVSITILIGDRTQQTPSIAISKS